MSAKFSTSYAKIVRNEFDNVGKNNTPLSKLSLAVHTRRYNKEEDKYEITKTSFFDAVVWGDKAVEISLVPEGEVLDLSGEIKEGEYGPYHSAWASIEDTSWENKDGEEITKKQVVIWNWKVREFSND